MSPAAVETVGRDTGAPSGGSDVCGSSFALDANTLILDGVRLHSGSARGTRSQEVATAGSTEGDREAVSSAAPSRSAVLGIRRWCLCGDNSLQTIQLEEVGMLSSR
jgi:hypothetical protein